MTETKFTPGPWVAYENAEDKCFYVAQQDGAPYTPDYSDVCGLECRTWSGERPIVQRANAHLIAAAPDGYALAKLVMEICGNSKGISERDQEELYEVALQYTNKARGES